MFHPSYEVFDAVELEVVDPLRERLLVGACGLREAVAFAEEVHVVVQVEGDVAVMGERERQDVVALDLLGLRGGVGGLYLRLGVAVAVVNRQCHGGMIGRTACRAIFAAKPFVFEK